MKIKPIEYPDDAKHYVFLCPACNCVHQFKVPPWGFNGNFESPTLDGSVLVIGPLENQRCHSLITNGIITFCDDCSHNMKGKSMPVPEFFI
jgi:hypothetical protein